MAKPMSDEMLDRIIDELEMALDDARSAKEEKAEGREDVLTSAKFHAGEAAFLLGAD